MKHIKLFENTLSIQSMKSTINEYDIFIKYIRPFVMEKYDELAQDEDYIPESGDTPTLDDYPDLMYVNDLGTGLSFYLQGYDENDYNHISGYYIFFKYDELENWIKYSEIRKETKKFNI
jgi:hypothetical protein